jgi:hypothetical protein
LSNKSKVPFIVIICAALTVVLICFIYTSQQGYKHNWTETYRQNSEEPYGTSLFSELLRTHYGNSSFSVSRKPLHDALSAKKSDGIKNYVFVGGALYLSPEDADTLLAFVRKGNQAFLATHSIPDELEDSLGLNDCHSSSKYTSYVSDTTCRLNLCHPSLASDKGWVFHYEFNGKKEEYDWDYFNFKSTCDSNVVYQKLGYSKADNVNFIRIPYGNGWFYLHSNPIVFTNFNLIHEPGIAYCERVFSHLPTGKTMLDESSKLPSAFSHHRENFSQGPLSYILSQSSFRWAWYTLLLLLAVFFLFRTVRRQRVIPIILPKENTSLEFIQTVGALYYQQRDHQKICAQKMRLFLLFIRDRYYLPTNISDAKLIDKISAKSKVPHAEVATIFSMHRSLQQTVIKVNTDDLFAFQKQLDFFYNTCS